MLGLDVKPSRIGFLIHGSRYTDILMGKSCEGETVTGVLVPGDKGWPSAMASELEVCAKFSLWHRGYQVALELTSGPQNWERRDFHVSDCHFTPAPKGS